MKRYTADVDAYNLYLKGRYFWNKRSEEGMRKSVQLFQEAIEKDTSYALAYAGLADAYIVLGDWGILRATVAYPEAEAAALKALGIDNSLGEAHNSLGHVKAQFEWDWEAAEAEFRRAIALNPNYATAHQWYAEYLSAMGRHDEAIEEIRRAQELDPLSLIVNAIGGFVFLWARQYDDAIKECKRTLEMDSSFIPAHFYLQWAYEQKGMYKEAVEQGETLMMLRGERPGEIDQMRSAFAKGGMKAVYRWELDRLYEALEKGYVDPGQFAVYYALLDDKVKALDWLEEAYEERSPAMKFLRVDPQLDNLRSQPRFVALVKKVGFDK